MYSWLMVHRGSALLNQEYMIVSVLFCLSNDEQGLIVQSITLKLSVKMPCNW